MPSKTVDLFFRPIAAALLAATLLGASSAAAQTEPPSTTVAVVNSEEITLLDLEKRLEELHGEAGPTQRSIGDLDRLLFRVVNDVLIGQEARALGLQEEPPIPKTIERNRRQLAVSILEQIEIDPESTPTEDEVRELFTERYSRATFHILTASEREGTEALLDAMQAGADAAAVAREMSIDPYAETGGLVEDVVRKDLQLAIANVVFQLEPNQVAGPIETDRGWSLLVAKSFQEPDPDLYQTIRPRLERIVRQRKESEVRKEFLERLREEHDIVIDEPLVAAITPVRRLDGRLTAESPGPEGVVARIGETLTLSGEEYAEALERRWRTVPEEDAARAAAPIILETLINERLLIAEAYRRGYHEQSAVRRALHGLETEMLIPKYLEIALASGIEVTGEEKRAYYEEHREELRRPPRVRLGQITVATEEKAREVAAALRGGTDLAWLAERRSTDGLRTKGGLQDWWSVPPDGGERSKAFLEAPAGTVMNPVRSEDSWVVYKVMAREEQGVFGYDEVSGNMREAVFRQKFTAVLDRFIKTARERSEIEIREEVLAALRLSGTREEGEAAPAHGSGHGGHGS